jgi:dephospho-CoA kinase
MITAIIGRIGSGKSSLASIIENEEYRANEVIHTDFLVRGWYNTDEGLACIENLFKDEDLIHNGKVDKNLLLLVLISNPCKREKLEQRIFDRLIKPRILEYRKSGKDLYIDGIVPNPKFLKYIDQVIYVERRDKDIVKDLKTGPRKMSTEKIKAIQKLQEDMFPKIL